MDDQFSERMRNAGANAGAQSEGMRGQGFRGTSWRPGANTMGSGQSGFSRFRSGLNGGNTTTVGDVYQAAKNTVTKNAKGIGPALVRGTAALAGLQGAYRGLTTDTDDYYERLGIEPEATVVPQWVKNTGVRGLGELTDVGAAVMNDIAFIPNVMTHGWDTDKWTDYRNMFADVADQKRLDKKREAVEAAKLSGKFNEKFPTDEKGEISPADFYMGPERTTPATTKDKQATPNTGFNPNVIRQGDRINTDGGYIQSADAEGMARVEAGLRNIRPKDKQSYVSNNFMTVPAYKTPQSLLDLREKRAETQRRQDLAPPEAPNRTGDPETDAFNLKVYNDQLSGYGSKMSALAAAADREARIEDRREERGFRADERYDQLAKQGRDLLDKERDRAEKNEKEMLDRRTKTQGTLAEMVKEASAGPDGKTDPAAYQKLYNRSSEYLRKQGVDLNNVTPDQMRDVLALADRDLTLTNNLNELNREQNGDDAYMEEWVPPESLGLRKSRWSDLLDPKVDFGDIWDEKPVVTDKRTGAALGMLNRLARDPRTGGIRRSIAESIGEKD